MLLIFDFRFLVFFKSFTPCNVGVIFCREMMRPHLLRIILKMWFYCLQVQVHIDIICHEPHGCYHYYPTFLSWIYSFNFLYFFLSQKPR